MISIRSKVQYKGATLRATQRQLNTIMRESFFAIGEWFHENLLPKRFTYHGGKELGYSPRKPSYVAAKKKKHGHIDPLVWSGRSKKSALQTQRIEAKATSRRAYAEIAINAPALNFRHPASSVVMSNEVRRISDREARAITDRLAEEVDKRMNQLSDFYEVS